MFQKTQCDNLMFTAKPRAHSYRMSSTRGTTESDKAQLDHTPSFRLLWQKIESKIRITMVEAAVLCAVLREAMHPRHG